MSQILAQYEHKEEGSKEIQLLPVSISDVDEMWIWLTVHKSPFEQWHVAVPWSQVVNELLPRGVKALLEAETKQLGDGATGSTAACEAADGGFESPSPYQPGGAGDWNGDLPKIKPEDLAEPN